MIVEYIDAHREEFGVDPICRVLSEQAGNSLKVPDTDANRCWLGRIRYRMGFAGYPTVALMPLVETGTRALIGATLGSAGDRDEPGLARRLLGLLRPDVLVLPPGLPTNELAQLLSRPHMGPRGHFT